MILPPTRLAAALIAAASLALLLGALGFQYLGGYPPCVLCYWQRYAHVAATVLAIGAVLIPRAAGGLLGAAALALFIGAGIAGFHVGVEQHWWQGTAECGSSVTGTSGIEELRARLLAQPVVRCDEVAWSLFGISMAGYNLLISLAFGAVAAAAAGRDLRSRAGL